MSWAAFDAEAGFPGDIRDHHVEGARWCVVRRADRRIAIRQLGIGLSRRPVVNHNLHGFPPRCISSLARAEADSQPIAIGLAAERLAEKLAALVVQGVAVIEIKGPR